MFILSVDILIFQLFKVTWNHWKSHIFVSEFGETRPCKKMKIAIIFVCLTAGTFAFSYEDIKLDEIVPIYETVEFQQHYPQYAQLTKEASFSNNRQARIWNGVLAADGELPYMVGIVVLLSRQAFCGGSIVSNNFVLSAASCFPGWDEQWLNCRFTYVHN